jgi:zinc protease
VSPTATPVNAGGQAVRERLPNGLTVIVRENPAAPVVALTLFVEVGARHETAETNGVTTLLGRVLLKGTRTRSALELAQLAEDTGGVLESATDQEYSELRARGLARHWRTLLALLHDVATAPALASDEVERERQILLAQIRGLEDQPFQVASRLLGRALYGGHPCGFPTAGEPASIGRLTQETLRSHVERFFSPERMILVVSGQVHAGDVMAEAARVFGELRGRGVALALTRPPERPVTPRLWEPRPTQQAQLLVGYLAPPIGHPDHVALKLLNAILGGGMSGRLFRTLRDEEGLAYAVGSFYPTRREAARLVVHIGTAPANMPQAEAGIAREVGRVREEPVPADELGRGKAFLAGALDLDLRTNARQGFYLGFFELMGVGHGYLARYPEAIDAVGSADLQRVAQRWLVESSVAVVGPAEEGSGA